MSAQTADADVENGEMDYIRLEGLSKSFGGGDIIAIEQIDLSVGEDEFVVLLGPSGCGKTTTLRCIAGLENPDNGSITVNGKDITNRKPKDRDFAFVFQQIALFPHMSVRENIRFGLDMNTDLGAVEKKERVEDAAAVLGIEELLERKPKELSGGQQQRVSLGRAMVMEPAAFLLDEPFSALDANLRDQMRVEIKKLQRRLNTAMIFVTHDQEEAMTLGDKIVVMNNAQIQQIGSPYEIYNEPVNYFVAAFIGSPSTNMIDCDMHRTGDDVELTSEIFTLTLSGDRAAQIEGENDGRVTLGIRPDYLEINQSRSLFEAEISVIEPHGPRDAIHLLVDGMELTAVTPQHQIDRNQESVSVGFDRDQIWLFNSTGDRIL